MIPREREHPLDYAKDQALRLIEDLGLTYDLRVAGSRVVAANCTLRDFRDGKVASGLGKGGRDASVVGALCESAEHYLSGFEFVDKARIEYHPSDIFQERHPGVLSDLLSSVVSESSSYEIPCLRHASLCGGRDVPYPIGMLIPGYVDDILVDRSSHPEDRFEYRRLGEYSSNTGVAIGVGRTESLVHGLLEVVERDTVSRFLVRSFIKAEPESLRKVRISSLPGRLQDLVRNLSIETGGAVGVYELENRFGIPTFASCLDREVQGICPHGFGSSLVGSHAVERSLDELAQHFLATEALHPKPAITDWNARTLGNLDDIEPLLRCARFNLHALERSLGHEVVDFYETGPGGSDLDAYLEEIVDRIATAGADAFYHQFSVPVDTEMTVTHCFISGQDHFFNVMSGRITMPDLAIH